MNISATWARRGVRNPVCLSATAILLGGGGAIVPLAFSSVIASAGAPAGINFTVLGCHGSESMVSSTAPYVCPDADYVDGNLGKQWNELDLVPMRLTATATGSAPATQTYQVATAADYLSKKGVPGFDFMSVPTLDTALSDASCTALSAVPSTGSGDTLAAPHGDTAIYRELTITQARNTTCVYDYYQRLAVGSAQYDGSSLHSYLASVQSTDGVVTDLDAIPGVKTIPIPVNPSTAPSLSVGLAATQGNGYSWSVNRSAAPSPLSISSTCTAPGRSAGVDVTVSWQRSDGPVGQASVVESVYASNPTHRALDVAAIAYLYDASNAQVAKDVVGATVPASSSNYLVATLTHGFAAGASSAYTSDVQGGFTDPITKQTAGSPQSASANQAVSQVQSTANSTATVTDTLTISGAGLHYSVDSVSLNGGSLGGYALGTPTTGTVTWTSPGQSGDGSAVLHLTVGAGSAASSGSLSDSAAVTGGGSSSSTPLSIPASATAAPTCTTGGLFPAQSATTNGTSAPGGSTAPNGAAQPIKVPNTGAGELPWGEGGVLVLAGSGLLAWGLRRNRAATLS